MLNVVTSVDTFDHTPLILMATICFVFACEATRSENTQYRALLEAINNVMVIVSQKQFGLPP
jgi:hypothetical protein